jgi:RHS repeat-associated protein
MSVLHRCGRHRGSITRAGALAGFGLGLAASLVHATAAHALGGPSPGAVSAQTARLPAGPGSVRGLADNASVSSFTGQVQYAVPVELPAGPAGLSPTLALGYAGELGNGPLGVGWQLSQAGIRRSTRLGVPSYTAADELELVGMGGGDELVHLADGSYRVEGQGNGTTGREVDGGFELTDPDGTVYRFGTTAAGRKASGNNVSFWYLEEVRDLIGQTIVYRYRAAAGEVYLDRIEWGPEVDGAGAFAAELVYGARADAVVSYRTGFRVEAAQRLDQIKVWSFGEVQRVMTLAYDDSFALTRLAEVTVTSADGSAALPPLSFSYAAASGAQLTAVTGTDGWALNLAGTSLFDVDDDGAMDLLRLATGGHSYRRNLGGRFDVVRAVAGADGAALDNVRLLDLTGDSGAEMVWQQGTQWKVFQLGGPDAATRRWQALGNWSGAQSVALATVAVADLDGDYRMDVLQVSGTRIQVRMGTESGLAEAVRFPAIDPARTYIQPGNPSTSFPDINGDGLADAAYLASSALYLYLGKGNGQFEKYRDVSYPWTGAVDQSQIRLGDLNRDGLLDAVVVRAGNVAWYRGQANGTLAATPIEMARPPGTDSAVVVSLADGNGNGSEDIVWSSTAGMWLVDLAGPTSAGMLVAIDNGLGQTQSFGYQASAELAFAAADSGAPWTTSMPISIPVSVKTRLTLASGELPRSTRLGVRDGIYDRGERRFIGFAEATVTRPDPDDGAAATQTVRRIQRFHPGLGADRVLRGRVVYERTEDGGGHVYRETTTELAALAVAGLPASEPRLRRAAVVATEVAHHEGQATPITTRTEIDHDDEGRISEERSFGRVDLIGDEVIRRRRYTSGRSTRGVRDRICEEWLVGPGDGAGSDELLVSHTQTLYGDDQTEAALCDASAGWPRVTRQYLDGSDPSWIETQRASFDARGNRITTTEGGVTRRLSFDAHGLHPLAETVEPRAGKTLRWDVTWDYVQGKPVRVDDASGSSVEAAYDGLGRLTSLARSGAQPHVHYRYQWSGPRPSIETFAYDGDIDAVPALPTAWTAASGWRHTVEIANSAGEPLLSATQLDASQWIVAGWRQRDALGRTTASAEAFEWQGSQAALATAALPTGTPVRTVAYDGLDRIASQTLPTGGRNQYAYRAFETTVSTDGLAPVTSTFDGAGRIRRTARTVAGIVEAVEAGYDPAGRITALTIPVAGGAAVVHRFEYDTLGRLVFATDPDIGDRDLSYDDGGRLITQVNGAAETTSYQYDGAGRLASMVASDGSQFVYHYDDARDDSETFRHTGGRLAWVEEPTGRVELGYDAFGRVEHLRRSVDGETADEKTRHGASGLMLEVDYGDGLTVDMAYDAAGRAVRAGDLWQTESQDAAGRILRERFGNGVVQAYERDLLGQSTRIEIRRPSGTALYDASVGYNAYGAITSVVDSDGAGLDHSATFGYDGGARLIDALVGSGAGQYHFSYAYDGLQNMIRRGATGPSALGILAGDYHYGGTASTPRGPRQLTSVTAAGGATTTFGYDDAGRVVAQAGMALDYNGLDQLVRVRNVPGTGGGTGTVEHAYGYDGLRVLTRDPAGRRQIWFTPTTAETADGVREHYLRLGNRLIARVTRSPAVAQAEARARAVRDGRIMAAAVRTGLGGVGGAVVLVALLLPRRRRRHAGLAALLVVSMVLAGCGTTSSTSALAARVTSQTLFYHQGIAAGPTVITRGDGSVFEERRYEPFGAAIDAYRETAGTGSVGTVDYGRDPHNVLDKPTDAATGWSYHGARWMAPETARWLTPDPPVKAPDARFLMAPWGLHPYQYVKQNPVLFYDPTGNYEELVHGALTYHLAIAAGFTQQDAAQIALNTQGVDESVQGHPVSATNIGAGRTQLYHFNAPAAAKGFWGEVAKGKNMNLTNLGVWLHGLEDADGGPHSGSSLGHPFRVTESGHMSHPLTPTNDQPWRNPGANTTQMRRLYGYLKQAAVAKYGAGNVTSDDKAAYGAIDRVMGIKTRSSELHFANTQLGDGPDGPKSYLDWRDDHAAGNVSFGVVARPWSGWGSSMPNDVAPKSGPAGEAEWDW